MRRLAVAVGAVAVLALGGVAFAQTNGDERIYACVSNGDGAVRVHEDPEARCPRNWSPLSWASEQPVVPPPPVVPQLKTYKNLAAAFTPAHEGNSLYPECDNGDYATGGGYAFARDDIDVKFNVPWGNAFTEVRLVGASTMRTMATSRHT